MAKVAATRALASAKQPSRSGSTGRGATLAREPARARPARMGQGEGVTAVGAGSLVGGASPLAFGEPASLRRSPALGGERHGCDVGSDDLAAAALAVDRQAGKQARAQRSHATRRADAAAPPNGGAYHLDGTKRERVNARFTRRRGSQHAAPRRPHGASLGKLAPTPGIIAPRRRKRRARRLRGKGKPRSLALPKSSRS